MTFVGASFSNRFAKQYRKNDVLAPHLNNWFANAEFPDEIPIVVRMNKEEDTAFHPSSALACDRELYAMLLGDGVDKKNTYESYKNFMIGHMYHGLFQHIFVEELGFATWDDIEKEHDYHFETEAGNPYRVRGFIDIAHCVIPNVGERLVDIKTVNARLFAQDSLPAKTMAKYEAQVKLYLSFEGMDEAIILAIEKDSPHKFKEFRVQADPAFVDETLERWESVVDAAALGEVPEHTCFDPKTCSARGIYDGAIA